MHRNLHLKFPALIGIGLGIPYIPDIPATVQELKNLINVKTKIGQT